MKKQIKALTDFGIVDVTTIGSKRDISGELWIVANRPVKYMNAKEPLIIRKVLHYSTGTNLPIRGMAHNSPAKDYLCEAENFLKRIPLDAIKKEVAGFEIINPS